MRWRGLQVDGTSALREATAVDPTTGTSNELRTKTYRLHASTGETCCSSFWVKLNQRMHLLHPEDERFSAEIEKTIYNALLRQMVFRRPGSDPLLPPPGIRYYANMEGNPDPPNNHNTCCEGQGSRILASIPEYIYSLQNGNGKDSTTTRTLLINMFAASSITLNVTVAGAPSPSPPPLSWRLIKRYGYYGGYSCVAGSIHGAV